jgi:hypothetical protein
LNEKGVSQPTDILLKAFFSKKNRKRFASKNNGSYLCTRFERKRNNELIVFHLFGDKSIPDKQSACNCTSAFLSKEFFDILEQEKAQRKQEK